MTTARHAEMRSLAKLLGLTRPLIVFDVETTGTLAEKDRVLQIGFLKIYPDGVVEEKQIDLDPETDIPAEATKTHGITAADVEGKPKFRQIAKQLAGVFEDCDICGYNVKFDIKFLQEEFKRVRGTAFPTIGGEENVVDPFRIYVEKFPRDLRAAVKEFLGEDLANAHTALADARGTARVLNAQLKRFPDIPRTVKGINDLFNRVPEGYVDAQRKLILRDGKPVFAFGKNVGENLEDVPLDYLGWIMRKDFSEVVRDVVSQEIKRREEARKTKIENIADSISNLDHEPNCQSPHVNPADCCREHPFPLSESPNPEEEEGAKKVGEHEVNTGYGDR